MQRKLDALPASLLDILKEQYLFRNIDSQLLTSCLQRVEEIHALTDELIFKRGESYHKGVYFILSGAVRMSTSVDSMEISAGEALGITTFLGKTMYTVTAKAESDSDLLFIDEYSIYSLMEKAPEFRDKFMKFIAERLNNLDRMSNKTGTLSAFQSVGGCMNSPLITIHNSKSIADAARLMKEHDIGAVVIMNRKHVLKGLLTLRHITHKYLTDFSKSPEQVLAEEYANPEPLMLPQEYPLVEVLAEMHRRREDYALITRKNKPAGIISKSDVIGLLSNESDVFGATVSRKRDISELKEVTKILPKILENMMFNTSLFRDILPTLSSNHLIIQKRAFELVKNDFQKEFGFEILPSSFCLVSLGSLARREMTLVMTQDHAVVLNDNVSEKDVELYRTFFKRYSDSLVEIGYRYHPFGLSVNNPEMIKTISDWRDFISVSVHKSNDANIPNTRILFDCERLDGEEGLLWEFKDCIYSTVKEKSLFFGRLVNYQSLSKIPISQFGSFITEDSGEHADTIDLKSNALNFITYTSQAFSFYNDLLDINTVRRIEHLGRKKVFDDSFAREVISAYEAIVDLTLHEQINQFNKGESLSFKIMPFKLSMHNQEKLKRALHIISRYFGEGLAHFR